MKFLPALFALLFLLTMPHQPSAAPEAVLWERWTAFDNRSEIQVDHSFWDRFLTKYQVSGIGGVNRMAYGRVAPKDKKALSAYVKRLEGVPVSKLSRNEQRAFWINLYNALVARLIIDHYPVKSILDINISPGLFSEGPWGVPLVKVEGEDISLDDIEHRILRPAWNDERVHYALNCAALGCPNLQDEAYTAKNTNRLLEKAARDYINDPRGVGFSGSRLIVSSIYKWYVKDFGDNEASVISHFRRYAGPVLRGKLEGSSSIDEYAYDWSLNDAP
jgi:hypothetical protein